MGIRSNSSHVEVCYLPVTQDSAQEYRHRSDVRGWGILFGGDEVCECYWSVFSLRGLGDDGERRFIIDFYDLATALVSGME